MTPAQREQLNRFLVMSVFTILLAVGVAQAEQIKDCVIWTDPELAGADERCWVY